MSKKTAKKSAKKSDKIFTCLSFKTQALDAAKFYVSVFKNSKLGQVSHYGDYMPQFKGKVLAVEFTLDGKRFMTLNGPDFNHSAASSQVVGCKNQKEIDRLWAKLSKGGRVLGCGWVEDKFGVAWQVVPAGWEKMVGDGTGKKTQRYMAALMTMNKLDVKALKKAYNGK
jgi:predicted 3-demethylubiquinone-9 3-methyltransferase (glyoxalase superfamily)